MSSAAPKYPTERISLWGGENFRFGKEVTLYAFRPEKPNGMSIIICPGGSYFWLSRYNEGFRVGEWLSSNGITAFVLFYRTAGRPELVVRSRRLFRGKRYPDMFADVQRALQYVHEHASQYNIDTGRIGMMGFSAGGHLILSSECNHTTDFLKPYGFSFDVNIRPAFLAAIYPVVTMKAPFVHKRSRRGLLGDNMMNSPAMQDLLSVEDHIPDDFPPVFLTNCIDDPVVPYQNSELLDSALIQKGIPHKYIQYKTGKHGFGANDECGSPESREWKKEFLEWLRSLYQASV